MPSRRLYIPLWILAFSGAGMASPEGFPGRPPPEPQGSRSPSRGRASAPGRAALEAVEAVLEGAKEDVSRRLPGLPDGGLKSLLLAPGSLLELRRQAARARDEAGFDVLLAVAPGPRSGAPRLVLPSEDLAARAASEEGPRAQALAARILAAAGGAPFVASLPPGCGLVKAGEEESAKGTPALLCVVRLGPEAAIAVGTRIGSLSGAIERSLTASAPPGWAWSAFLVAAGEPGGESGGIVALGEGAGDSLPAGLVRAVASAGRVSWHRPGTARAAGGAPWRWSALRDASGTLVGGVGVGPRLVSAAVAGKTPVDGEVGEAGEYLEYTGDGSGDLAAAGIALVLAALIFIGPSLRRMRRRRRGRRRASRARRAARARRAGVPFESVRGALTEEVRSTARQLADPARIGPMLERSLGKAVEGVGGRLAFAIGERLAGAIAGRLPREEPPPSKQPLPGADPLGVLGAAALDPLFPLALVAVDADGVVTAWNPAAQEVLGASAEERMGLPLKAARLHGLEGEVLPRVRKVLETGVAESPVRLSFDRERVRHVQLAVIPLSARGEAAGLAASAAGAPQDLPESGRDESPARTSPPGSMGALLAFEDVSEKVESEVSAKVLGHYQRALGASLPFPIVVTDAEDRVMSWNAAAVARLGVPEKDALGKELAGLGCEPPAGSVPFRDPDGSVRGTLHIYGKAAAAIEGATAADAPAAGDPSAAPVPAAASA